MKTDALNEKSPRRLAYPNRSSNKLTGVRSFTMKDISVLADFFKVSTDYLLGRIDTLWPIVQRAGPESADDEVRCP